MLWIALLAAGGLAWFIGWFFFTEAPPTTHRDVGLEKAAHFLPALAMAIPGSWMEVEDRVSGRAWRIAKAADEGGTEQEVVLAFHEEGWPRPVFERVVDAYRSVPYVSRTWVGGVLPRRTLEVSIRAKPMAMEYYGSQLMHTLRTALELEPEATFDLRIQAPSDRRLWRRINEARLREMAEPDQPWLFRIVAKHQLRKRSAEAERGDV